MRSGAILNPELSNAERETQAYLERALEETGFEHVSPAAGFSLVVDIVGEAGPSNRKMAIWAGIDVLPIAESSGVLCGIPAAGRDARLRP